MSRLSNAVLRVAREQLGQGEEDGNNRGFPVARYKRGKRALFKGSWCAAFVSWCIEEASYGMGYTSPLVERSHGARRLFRNACTAGTRIYSPDQGALVCWRRGTGWQGHIGIVSEVHGGKGFYAIEGNVGPFPARVSELWHPADEAKLIGFARLP